MRPGTTGSVGHLAELLDRKKDAVAILMPPSFAFSLADEVYPRYEPRAWGTPALDRVNRINEKRQSEIRRQLRCCIEKRGHIGSMLGRPAFVVDDVVVCALSARELKGHPMLQGIELPTQLLERMDEHGF